MLPLSECIGRAVSRVLNIAMCCRERELNFQPTPIECDRPLPAIRSRARRNAMAQRTRGRVRVHTYTDNSTASREQLFREKVEWERNKKKLADIMSSSENRRAISNRVPVIIQSIPYLSLSYLGVKFLYLMNGELLSKYIKVKYICMYTSSHCVHTEHMWFIWTQRRYNWCSWTWHWTCRSRATRC